MKTTNLEGLNESELQWITRRDISELQALVDERGQHYRRKEIDKPDGGSRALHIPSDQLKEVQKRLNRKLFQTLRPHSATACVPERGVRWALEQHAPMPHLYHGDISSFFPSTSRDRVLRRLRRLRVREPLDALLADLVTVDDQLPQGAPTSVAIGDIVLFPLDVRIDGLAKNNGLQYTRYIDDIALSGGRRVHGRYSGYVEDYADVEGWDLNEKGGRYGPDERQELLGAVINLKPNVSKEYYSDLRSVLRLAARGRIELTSEQLEKLESQVQWVRHLNPEGAEHLIELLSQIPSVGN